MMGEDTWKNPAKKKGRLAPKPEIKRVGRAQTQEEAEGLKA